MDADASGTAAAFSSNVSAFSDSLRLQIPARQFEDQRLVRRIGQRRLRELLQRLAVLVLQVINQSLRVMRVRLRQPGFHPPPTFSPDRPAERPGAEAHPASSRQPMAQSNGALDDGIASCVGTILLYASAQPSEGANPPRRRPLLPRLAGGKGRNGSGRRRRATSARCASCGGWPEAACGVYVC